MGKNAVLSVLLILLSLVSPVEGEEQYCGFKNLILYFSFLGKMDDRHTHSHTVTHVHTSTFRCL